MDRREKLLACLDVPHMQGAEIGALAGPVVSRKDGPILYIDHADTETLKQKYKDHDGVDKDAIVHVDAIWGDNTLSEALGPDRKVDYILASHVVEHIPDLVSWFGELGSVLKPGGTVRLAVPDLRFCFDYRRAESQLADVLTAYLTRARRPQPREIIDFYIHLTTISSVEAWNGSATAAEPPGADRLELALDLARRSIEGEYLDVHCWTFTLASFAGLMQDLGRLGLNTLACVRAFDTEINDLEFLVIMQPASQAEVVESWRQVREEAKASVTGKVETWPEVRRRWLKEGYRAEIAPYEAEIEELRRDLAETRRQVAEIQHSTSWRITGPVRGAVQRLRGLPGPR